MMVRLTHLWFCLFQELYKIPKKQVLEERKRMEKELGEYDNEINVKSGLCKMGETKS